MSQAGKEILLHGLVLLLRLSMLCHLCFFSQADLLKAHAVADAEDAALQVLTVIKLG